MVGNGPHPAVLLACYAVRGKGVLVCGLIVAVASLAVQEANPRERQQFPLWSFPSALWS